MIGKPYSGKLNVRFDEGELEIEHSSLRQFPTLPKLRRVFNMQKKWFQSWPEGVPRTLVFPEKALPEFLNDHARQTPEKVAFNFYGR